MAGETPITPNYLGETVIEKNITITNQLFQSTQEGLTAKAGGGQAGATPITSMCARFTTVATTLDSAILPTAVPGLEITVINGTPAANATSLNVFPDVGSSINATAANTALAVPSAKTAIFFTTVAGTWHSILSA
jgi:hypothetical protein